MKTDDKELFKIFQEYMKKEEEELKKLDKTE